jgi:hypothetical protein
LVIRAATVVEQLSGIFVVIQFGSVAL